MRRYRPSQPAAGAVHAQLASVWRNSANCQKGATIHRNRFGGFDGDVDHLQNSPFHPRGKTFLFPGHPASDKVIELAQTTAVRDVVRILYTWVSPEGTARISYMAREHLDPTSKKP